MTIKTIRNLLIGTAFAVMLSSQGVMAGGHVAPLEEFAKTTVAEWIKDPMIVKAIMAQNAKNANLSEADIIVLDKKWRAETKASSKPMIDSLLGNAVSKALKGRKGATSGMVTEIFIMDNKGMNVGQSDVTSDYWQGDEAKWKKTYKMGPDAIFVDEVEKDESTQTLQSQMSMSIKDPASGKVIGAITVGVNVDAL
jgi:hypothetical protein